MCVPAVRDLCAEHTVKLVCGTYAYPAWEWAKNNIVGCDWEMLETVEDPDIVTHEYCPGKGTLSLNAALAYVRGNHSGETVLGYEECGSYYCYGEGHRVIPDSVGFRDKPEIRLRGERAATDVTVIHPYTKHIWKNCGLVVRKVAYRNRTICVGLPEEEVKLYLREAADQMDEAAEMTQCHYDFCASFSDICEHIVSCRGFVGVLSAWSNLAALMQKPQIVASFTSDVPLACNPNAVVMVEPTQEQLQEKVNEMGL